LLQSTQLIWMDEVFWNSLELKSFTNNFLNEFTKCVQKNNRSKHFRRVVRNLIGLRNDNRWQYFKIWWLISLSQTSFSLYPHNQQTNFYKLSCAGKPQIRAICTYIGCTKVTTNNWDIRSSVTIKALFANISWTARWICTIKLALESTHQTVSNNI